VDRDRTQARQRLTRRFCTRAEPAYRGTWKAEGAQAMSGVGEGIGTAIEGGLLGRAVDPHAGEAGSHADAPTTCLNCGTVFTGHFCPQCGQHAHLHRSLAAIGHDIMHGVLHLDGKLWDTLPLLAFKPGELTRRYIAGERAKFVSPMAMFLFTVFAMFAVFQIVGVTSAPDLSGVVSVENEDTGVVTNVRTRIAELEKERRQHPPGSPEQAEIDEKIELLRGFTNGQAISNNTEYFSTGIDWFDNGILKKWKSNPNLMFYKLQSNGYKFSWLLIPLSIPFLWIMFAWRRQFKAYDHAVFVTYSLAFMSLLFIVMSILSTVPEGADWAALLFIIAAPTHLYKQLRYAYGLSRFSALWRFAVLLICTQIVLVLFLLTVGALGAF
jgi:hypothetical protein